MKLKIANGDIGEAQRDPWMLKKGGRGNQRHHTGSCPQVPVNVANDYGMW
jgi:hypothetical protein